MALTTDDVLVPEVWICNLPLMQREEVEGGRGELVMLSCSSVYFIGKDKGCSGDVMFTGEAARRSLSDEPH